MVALQPGLGAKLRVEIDEAQLERAKATYEKAPGYTELGQVLKSKINQDKGKLLDNHFARIFNANHGWKNQKVLLGWKENTTVLKTSLEAWNRKSNAFAQDWWNSYGSIKSKEKI